MIVGESGLIFIPGDHVAAVRLRTWQIFERVIASFGVLPESRMLDNSVLLSRLLRALALLSETLGLISLELANLLA